MGDHRHVDRSGARNHHDQTDGRRDGQKRFQALRQKDELHNASDVVAVQDEISRIPQVVSVFDVTGDSDCMAWIACIDREEFSSVVKKINAIEGVTRTNTSVIMDIRKDPFTYIPPIL